MSQAPTASPPLSAGRAITLTRTPLRAKPRTTPPAQNEHPAREVPANAPPPTPGLKAKAKPRIAAPQPLAPAHSGMAAIPDDLAGSQPAPAQAASTPPTRPARNQPPLNRDQILDATALCLDELGYEGTTIRTIAKRLRCAVGSIYRYFTDKTELLDAVIQQRFVPVADAIQAGQPLEQTLRDYHAAAAVRPEQYRLMFWLAAVGRTPDQPAVLPPIIADILAGWTQQLGDANQARCRWAMLHGQLMLGQSLDCEHLPDLPPPHEIAVPSDARAVQAEA